MEPAEQSVFKQDVIDPPPDQVPAKHEIQPSVDETAATIEAI